jgi:hypothetical protein
VGPARAIAASVTQGLGRQFAVVFSRQGASAARSCHGTRPAWTRATSTRLPERCPRSHRRVTRSGVVAFPIAAGLLAMHSPDETDAHGRHKRRMKRHERGDGGYTVSGARSAHPSLQRRLAPASAAAPPTVAVRILIGARAAAWESQAQPCDGRCGNVTNTCGDQATCDPCKCIPGCLASCEASDETTLTCVPPDAPSLCSLWPVRDSAAHHRGHARVAATQGFPCAARALIPRSRRKWITATAQGPSASRRGRGSV